MSEVRGATAGRPWNALQWCSLGLLLTSWLLSAALYDRLPDPVPTHWNISGRADGFTRKPWGALLSPLLLTIVYLVTAVNVHRTQRRERHADSRVGSGAYQFGVMTVLFLFSSLHVYPLLSASPAPMGLVFGMLLLGFGVVLPGVSQNRVLGIRTPWTLRSDDVWRRTHTFGSRVFLVGGAVQLALALADATRPYAMGAFLATMIVPVAYSWWISD